MRVDVRQLCLMAVTQLLRAEIELCPFRNLHPTTAAIASPPISRGSAHSRADHDSEQDSAVITTKEPGRLVTVYWVVGIGALLGILGDIAEIASRCSSRCLILASVPDGQRNPEKSEVA